MATADPLKRVRSAARRSSGSLDVETQQRLHYADLRADCGFERELAKPRRARVSWVRILNWAMLLTLIGAAVLFGEKLRDGTIMQAVSDAMPRRPVETKRWIEAAKRTVGNAATAGGNTTAPAEDGPPNLMEGALEAARPPAPEPVPEAAPPAAEAETAPQP